MTVALNHLFPGISTSHFELSQLSKVRAKSKRNKNTTFDVLRVAGDKFAPENGKMFLVKLC